MHGSWFSNFQPDCVRRNSGAGLGPLEHRLRVLDDELDDADATYYYEGYYVVAGDQNRYNNVAWRTCSPSWTGSAWNVATTGGRVEGPIINNWGDSRITLAASGDGDIIVGVDVTPLGGDVHHYEYAIYNLDSHREVRSLAMDAGASANVRNFAFHDVDHDANNDWSIVYAAGVLTFSTETFAQNPNANSIKYGSLFNFAFDADGPPQLSQKRIGLFRTGSPSLLSGFLTGPPIGPLFDCNMNGIEDAEDISTGTSGDCDMNGVPDECEGGCNDNGVPDTCDIANGTSQDCNMNGTPDECEAECNGNGVPDDCDIAAGTSEDCDSSGIPDECELGDNDCNGNGVPDTCELASGDATDCNGNDKIDECESLPDCNANGLPDLCDLASGTSQDANENGIPDECEVSPCACGDLAEPRNNMVDLADFSAFSACFGLTAPSESCPASMWSCADMDQNGSIDLEDYSTFSLLFGKQPAGFAPPNCMDVP
jgi:hypothetical protein